MSKSYDFNEKECKCCHEWWYSSGIKQDLCPNCYDYFKQLKQQLEEKDKEIERLNNILKIEIPAILKNTRNMLNERFIWINIK